MTKEEMSQLQDLRQEIEELDCKILMLQNRKIGMVADKVQASSREFPYTKTSVKISGFDYIGRDRAERQILQKKMLLSARKRQAEELEIRITGYINNVTDSKIRRMMEYKYIEGYTWEKIGQLLHCDRTAAEKAVVRYLKKHPEK